MNLDDLNSINGSLFSDADKSAAFSGIVCGSNGAPPPEGAGRAFMAGYSAAARWRAEAEEFQRKMSESGKTSAASRESKYGTSQPFHEQASNLVRATFDYSSNQATSYKLESVKEQQQESFATLTPWAPADEQQSEGVSGQFTAPSQPQASALPPAQQPAQPASPVKPRARGKFVPPTEDEWLAYCKTTFPTWKRSAALSVLAYYESVSWKGKSDWKACAKTCFHRARPWDLQEPVAQRKTMTPLERQKFEEEQAKNYVPAL